MKNLKCLRAPARRLKALVGLVQAASRNEVSPLAFLLAWDVSPSRVALPFKSFFPFHASRNGVSLLAWHGLGIDQACFITEALNYHGACDYAF